MRVLFSCGHFFVWVFSSEGIIFMMVFFREVFFFRVSYFFVRVFFV